MGTNVSVKDHPRKGPTRPGALEDALQCEHDPYSLGEKIYSDADYIS